jgi:MoaA/NifB/PqqE/SkfB family radical SAM enzyme
MSNENEKANYACLAPSQSLVITSTGRVAPCCTYKGECIPVDEFLDGDEANFSWIDEDLRNNIIPIGCRDCFFREHNGHISKRKKLQQYMPYPENGEGDIYYAEISLSNTCNLDCLMCDSDYSNKLTKLHKIFVNSGVESLKEVHEPFAQPPTYSLSLDQVKKLATKISSAKVVELIGGEPLLFKYIKEFFQFFKMAGGAPDDISITTNGTVFDPELFEIISSFNCPPIHINLSVDAIGEHYQYIRGIPFKVLTSSLDKFINSPAVGSISIKPTLTILNVDQMPQIISWVQSLNSKKVSLVLEQYTGDKDYLSPRSLTNKFRNDVIKDIQNSSLYDQYQDELSKFSEHLLSYSNTLEEHKVEARHAINILNDYRKMDFGLISSKVVEDINSPLID